jgi:hypothetical protein
LGQPHSGRLSAATARAMGRITRSSRRHTIRTLAEGNPEVTLSMWSPTRTLSDEARRKGVIHNGVTNVPRA